MGIDVSGGSGGTSVGLEDLLAAAARLHSAGGELGEALARVVAGVVTSGLAQSHPLSPATAAWAEAAIARATGPTGLVSDVAAIESLAELTRGAVAAYRASEAPVTAGLQTAREGVMVLVGQQVAGLVVASMVLEAKGVDVGAATDRLLFEVPGVGDLAGSTAGLTVGLATNPLTAPLLRPGLAGRDDADRGLDGGQAGPDELGLRLLADSAGAWGLLDDSGRAVVEPEPTPGPGARAPVDLASLARDQARLSDAEDYPGRVRVVEVPQERGSAWLVEISGTQVWDPRAGTLPMDVTTDVRLMAQESTVLADGVQQALVQAQAASGRETSGEPVLLAGHSLGGMVAAGLASSPAFRARHGPVSVVTMGSPVSRMPVPAEVPVLALQHTQDIVPRLDGRADPDRRSWVTVTRDLRGDTDVAPTVRGAHDSGEYVQTAAETDRSDAPSLRDWRQSHRQFFEPAPGSEATIRDYRIERLKDGP
jgi:hypothetical protein